MKDREPTSYQLAVRRFLSLHPEQIQGAMWVKVEGRGDEPMLVLDRECTIAFMEWCLANGLYTDRAKLEAGIREIKSQRGTK